jgi:hypothetical protein
MDQQADLAGAPVVTIQKLKREADYREFKPAL